MGLLSSLNREQKEAIGLLQIGTFLEYFDLMLYIHMAVVLNELFFPQSDTHTTSLLASFAFCSTFVFRPIGALVFGWLGDNIGRKSTIILTTAIMCFSCITMAMLPTYAQIGITASCVMLLCRVVQGMSCMGEAIGAKIYLTESIQRPARYPAVTFINVAADLGAIAALGIATLVTSIAFNWRYAFWAGAVIAFVGTAARTRLRETPEFLEMKDQEWKKMREEVKKEWDTGDDEAFSREFLETLKEIQPARHLEKTIEFRKQARDLGSPIHLDWNRDINFKTLFSYFLIYCGWPLCFYMAFVYFNPLLKEQFGYSSEDIIQRNFYLSIIMMISTLSSACLSFRFYPLKIVKVRGILTFLLMVALPFLITNVQNPSQLFLIQAIILLIPLENVPAAAIFLGRLPVFRRFTFGSFLFASAQAFTFAITSFALVYLGNHFGAYGLWLITIPVTVAFLYGVFHFDWLDREDEREIQRELEEDEREREEEARFSLTTA